MPFDQSRPYTLDRIVRIGITVGILYGVIMVMNYLSSVLIPFVISLLIAYLMFPLVKFFQERVFKSRIVATLVTLILFLSVAIGGFMIALPIIGSQFEKMGILLRNLVNQRTGGSLPEYLSSVEIYIREFAQRDEIKELLKLENIEALAERLLPSIYGVFSSSLNILLGFAGVMIIIFYIIFILLNFEEITNGWQDLIPNAFRKTLVTLLGDLRDGMENYFRAQSLIVAIVSLLFAIGFTIIGLPLGFVLGIFVGLLNYVPYLQNLGFLPASFLTLIHSLETGDSFLGMMGLVLLVFGTVQLIQESILVPKIMGDATGLNPAMILLSLTIWGKLLGMLGLLVALPITSLLISYYRRFLKQSELQNSKLILEPHHIDELIEEEDKGGDENNDEEKDKIIIP